MRSPSPNNLRTQLILLSSAGACKLGDVPGTPGTFFLVFFFSLKTIIVKYLLHVCHVIVLRIAHESTTEKKKSDITVEYDRLYTNWVEKWCEAGVISEKKKILTLFIKVEKEKMEIII